MSFQFRDNSLCCYCEYLLNDPGPICGFFFIVFIIGGISAIAIASAASRSKELNETFAILARRFKGRLHKAGWFQRPSVTFNHQGTWVRVDIHSTGGKNPTHYTQVHVGWPEPGFRMEVYPEGFFNRIGKFLGMRDLEIGSPRFDREYIITSNDPGMLRETLTEKAQVTIDSLRALRGNAQVYVAIRNYELLVKKLGIIDDMATLQRLVDLTLMIYDTAMAGQEKGIQILDVKTHTPVLSDGAASEQVMCQVCGDAIKNDVVFCRSCKTPHHQDCWQYYGKCSTFGCGQRSYRRKRSKKSKRRK